MPTMAGSTTTSEPDAQARESRHALAGVSGSRLQNERAFHDRQAAERALALQPHQYRFDDETYLRHESWIAPAFAMLGDVAGKRVLDLGCGHGMASVVLARRGAQVTACDLSPGYVAEARTRAQANNVKVQFLVCNGEHLPFADASFDGIWGNAILHHLDLRQSAPELKRVLRPNGRAVFCEPWAGNRWLNWARRALPYPGKQRTADEEPLGPCHLIPLHAVFPHMEIRGHQLLGMLNRVVKQKSLAARLAWCDDFLLSRWPRWQRYCRYVVLTLTKEQVH